MDNGKLLKEEVLRVSGVNPRKCMKCGKCSASCPSYDEMDIHPHQFVSAVENGELERLMQSDSLYKCLSCFVCVERCPRDVKPAHLVEAVRLAVIRQQGKNRLAQDAVPALLDEEMPQQAIVSALRKYRK